MDNANDVAMSARSYKWVSKRRTEYAHTYLSQMNVADDSLREKVSRNWITGVENRFNIIKIDELIRKIEQKTQFHSDYR